MKQSILFSVVGVGLMAGAAVPRVSNVAMTSDCDCRITYTLSEAPGIVTFDILTNGVSIGAANLTNAVGDVNKVVQPGAHEIRWNAFATWPGHKFRTPCVTAQVTAWPVNEPPDWLAVELTASGFPVTYYASEAALPWGRIRGNAKYKGDVLLMRKIPASHVLSFMGSPESEANHLADGRETRRMCTLTNDYYMAVYPLTERQKDLLQGSASPSDALMPALTISYNMLRYDMGNSIDPGLAVNFPTTGRETLGPGSLLTRWRVNTGIRLDLPTSAQWEFACRAGMDGPNNWPGGDGSMAYLTKVCAPGSETLGYEYFGYEVGLYEPNGYQLYDMIGNCFEWCLDYAEYGKTDEAATDPVGPTSHPDRWRVIRGYFPTNIHRRSAFLTDSVDSTQQNNIGFRLCVTLP